MNTYSRQAIFLGLLITAIVSVMALAGWFDRMERNTIDLRFRYARWREAPMSDQIRHVDIDDGAIDSVGRWPWDRSKLAEAIDEIHRAGAKTIAMDILLIDEQKKEVVEQAGVPITIIVDHDAALARAIGDAGGILPVQVAEGSIFGPDWEPAPAQVQLSHLMDTLVSNIRQQPEQVVERAGLTGRYAEKFLVRPRQFKEVAAWRMMRDWSVEGHTAESFGDFLRQRFGEEIAQAGNFPELSLLRQAWDQFEAWRVIRPFLLPPVLAWNSPRHRAPLPAFSRAAGGAGFVNAFADRDGTIRQAPMARQAPGGSALQFGLAAAAAFADKSYHDIDIVDDDIAFGSTHLPLDAGRLWVYWPTTDSDWQGVLRQKPGDSPTAGHTSIGALISLAEQRQVHQRNLARHQHLSDVLAKHYEIPGADQERIHREILDQARFMLEPIDAQARDAHVSAAKVLARMQAAGEIDESDGAIALNLLEWRELDRSVEAAKPALAAAENELRQRLDGKLVFVGWTSTAAIADFVQTPLGPRTPGVVVHAAIADQMLNGKFLRMAPAWAVIVLTPLLGLLCTLIAARASPLASTISVVLGLLTYIAVCGWWLFGVRDLVLPMVAPVTSGAGAWIACTAMQAVLFQRDRRRITRQFKARVSPELVDYLVGNPKALSMAGEQREITVMFTDIAGFTALSEHMDGPTTVAALNKCMSALTDSVTRHGGYVNKFLGDGLMAFWSAFHDDPQQAAHACAAAIECQHALHALNESQADAGAVRIMPKLSVRIGIATGKVVVGDCGAPPQLNDYTVIGNGVNLASRLESANKQFGTRILIDRKTRDAIDSTHMTMRPIGKILVVGQTTPVEVFEVCGAETDHTLIELTQKAVESFARGDYDASAAAWKRLAATFGPNKLSDFYLDAMADAGAVVNGAVRLREK